MADYTYINSTGAIVVDTSDTLTTVQQEWQQAFGSDLDLTESTPQGVMIAAEVTSRDSVARNNATLANQINPNLAGGVFLDAIMALTGSARATATYSTVSAALTGVAGVSVPAGSRVATAAGDNFALLSAVTLPGTGNFQAVSSGAIAAPGATLLTIVDSVLGWETATTVADAVLGAATQSDEAARVLRRNTLAAQGVALSEAITSALYAVTGVSSVFFRENYSNTAATIDGIAMAPNSIYVCVDGGADADVAAALLANKSLGCAWNGSTSISVADVSSGQTYAVQFDRPTLVTVRVQLTVSGTTIDAVKSAVLAYAAGQQDNEAGLVTGADVSPFEIAGAVARAIPASYISAVTVARGATGAYQATPIIIAANEKAVLTSANIAVTVA